MLSSQISYQIIRSSRKTMSLEIKADGSVVVRAPLRLSEAKIQKFVEEKQEWILKNLEKIQKRDAQKENVQKLSALERQHLQNKACVVIPRRVAYYAEKLGVSYGKITLRQQKTRWGSCAANGNLNFNWLLILAPPEVLDYVVVHELCHRREMNHSQAFWKEVEKILPDYRERQKWLKDNGYCTGDASNRRKLEACIDNGVKYATNAGMYVIIDWHILSDGNPQQNQKEALKFFKKMAKKYKNNTNVIYEICNEPNGGTSWSTIKKYAEKIIKGIRTYDKKAVILVGTPNWSQDVDQAALSPVSKKYRKNVMYTLHFYAATHKKWLRDKAQAALDKGLPLFVSEFSICDASGNGGLDKAEAKKWLTFLDKNNISYMAWSLSNKAESSAFIKSGCSNTGKWSSKNLTAAGKWITNWYKKK